MTWLDLFDAAGNVVPVDACRCGRPKPAAREFCCNGCRISLYNPHASGCNIRCATLGVSGFGVKASAVAPLHVREPNRPNPVLVAKRKGRAARLEGFSPAANPYRETGHGSAYHRAWQSGYEE